MKTIKILFVDFYADFDIYDNDMYRILSKHYIVEISDQPDYIFYSCAGFDHLRYNCIRIFFAGECVTPDFNICDYAIGYDYLTFGDRYIRIPLYDFFSYKERYERTKKIHMNADEIYQQTREFCCMVVSNDNGQIERKQIFDFLCKYKKVDSGGRYLNTLGYCVEDKQAFLREHKFSIAFENYCYSGYTTEKIVDAFEAGTIPIYLGDPTIVQEFNEKAFINCNNYASMEDVVKRVIEIDSDDKLYYEMLCEPKINKIEDYDLENFLLHIFDQNIKVAKRRINNSFSRDQEKRMRRSAVFEKYFYQYIKAIKSMARRIKNNAWKK